MNLYTILNDPILIVSLIFAIISLIFIILLSYYYKKIKEQKIVSEIVESNDSVSDMTEQISVNNKNYKYDKKSYDENTYYKQEEFYKEEKFQNTQDRNYEKEQKVDLKNVQLDIDNLNNFQNLYEQINDLSTYIKEMYSAVNDLQNIIEKKTLTEDNIQRISSQLEQLDSKLTRFLEITPDSIKDINFKLDKLLKLLSTILQ